MQQYPVIAAAIRVQVFADLQASFSDLDDPDGVEHPLTIETLVTHLFECEVKARSELK